jgi:hypothetical protein
VSEKSDVLVSTSRCGLALSLGFYVSCIITSIVVPSLSVFAFCAAGAVHPVCHVVGGGGTVLLGATPDSLLLLRPSGAGARGSAPTGEVSSRVRSLCTLLLKKLGIVDYT